MFVRDSGEASQRRQNVGFRLFTALNRIFSAASIRGGERRLRLCETLSLGEKRFVALVECDRRMYLLAGTPGNISLLQRLDDGSEPVNSGHASARDRGSDTSR